MKNILFYGSLIVGYYALIFPQIVKSSASWRGGYYVGGELFVPVLVWALIELGRTLVDLVKEFSMDDDDTDDYDDCKEEEK